VVCAGRGAIRWPRWQFIRTPFEMRACCGRILLQAAVGRIDRRMNAWLQFSDFSVKDVDLPDADAFLRFLDDLDLEKLDAAGREAWKDPQTFCPWGVGVNMDTSNGLHVYRADAHSDCFDVLHAKAKKKKFLGMIPTELEDSDFYERVDRERVGELVRMYYASIGGQP